MWRRSSCIEWLGGALVEGPWGGACDRVGCARVSSGSRSGVCMVVSGVEGVSGIASSVGFAGAGDIATVGGIAARQHREYFYFISMRYGDRLSRGSTRSSAPSSTGAKVAPGRVTREHGCGRGLAEYSGLAPRAHLDDRIARTIELGSRLQARTRRTTRGVPPWNGATPIQLTGLD